MIEFLLEEEQRKRFFSVKLAYNFIYTVKIGGYILPR